MSVVLFPSTLVDQVFYSLFEGKFKNMSEEFLNQYLLENIIYSNQVIAWLLSILKGKLCINATTKFIPYLFRLTKKQKRLFS